MDVTTAAVSKEGVQCPLWVISGHLARHSGMSAFCRLADMLSVGLLCAKSGPSS